MKNHIIISLLFLTFSYSKSNSNGGGGLGYGNGRLSFNVVGEIDGKYNLKKQKRDRYFFGMGGNIFGDRTDKNTYDFNEDLFDDKDLGKISESIFIVGGLVLKQSNNIDLYIGGGITNNSEYFKRDDDTEILGSEGYYYVEDDDGITWKPSLSIGFMNNLITNTYNFKKVGILLNVNPLFLNLVILW